MKKKCRNGNNIQVPKHKERHLVSWTPEEDDILREQIQKLGTDNWSIIASKFEDKTTRQCRRRWYSYLNSDFKKGGWSPDEDMLLCEAQKIFGNKWTEIAKVVSGRTDNAVKNRFSTLCKKRAKEEAFTEDGRNSFINVHNKRANFLNGTCNDKAFESVVVPKKMRTDISSSLETRNNGEKHDNSLVTSNGSSLPFSRRSDLHAYSPSISDYSTGSTFYCQAEGQRTETTQTDKCVFTESTPVQRDDLFFCEHTEMEFNSPIIQTPLFRSLAASVPTPNFSESERKFLLKTLGLESTSPIPTPNPTEPPPCKRVLLHSL